MKMIPTTAYPSNSKAELKIFERLKDAFRLQKDAAFYYALHSLNVTHHDHKRFAEADFLLVCPYGIYVLEIKGGRVSCQQGKWQFTDRHGHCDTKYESPFRQAQTALHAVKDKLIANLPHAVMQQFVIGYGVVMPDCRLPNAGAEWDDAVLCQAQACRDLQGWLTQLFAYWRAKDSKPPATTEAVLQVVDYLRPSFDAVIDTGQLIEAISDNVEILTATQLQLVQIIAANPRVICSGGAGTGKTFMAIRLAMYWAEQGCQTVLTCYSPWLCNYLQTQYPHPNLLIVTLQRLKTIARQKSLIIEVLIVDEAQDLLTRDTFGLFDRLLQGDLDGGRWCLFMDINQQSGLCGDVDMTVLEDLHCYQPAQIPLTTNCRNTANILQTIKDWLHADMGVTGAGLGLPVIRRRFDTSASLVMQLWHEIDRLIGEELIDPSQISILVSSSLQPSSDCIANLGYSNQDLNLMQQLLAGNLTQGHAIERMDSYAIATFPPRYISLLNVAEFKGLENDVIFFIAAPDDLVNKTNEAYVAMSRAKSLLYVYELSN